MSRRFGSEAWRGLFRDMALSHPWFRQPITASSLVPLPEFLTFHDELVRRFYPDRKDALFELGAESARWALVDGPLKRFVRDPGISSLVTTIPTLWNRYFSETDSRSEAALRDAGVEFRVHDLPAWHPYFEHFVIGYTKEMLELYCANPIWTHRLAGGRGTTYNYLLATDPAPSAPPSGERASGERASGGRARPVRSRRALTARELEVLRLVGVGKTNREIAVVLHISQKTVQHHIAHAYDKLGIYSRAGATLWLGERGLLG
ncbi:response regulator transcription factor [Sorangium sp. KYC3313]|uniref:response regulator transcription factor n=1 Tax=Sorangium sp. KYC3313 TaxID=3449740 RepID=UPI003F897754